MGRQHDVDNLSKIPREIKSCWSPTKLRSKKKNMQASAVSVLWYLGTSDKK